MICVLTLTMRSSLTHLSVLSRFEVNMIAIQSTPLYPCRPPPLCIHHLPNKNTPKVGAKAVIRLPTE